MSAATIRQRNRRRVFIILSASLGLGVALLCAELALRIYVASRGWTANCYVTGLMFFVPDEYAGHTLRPGLRLKSSTYDVSVNSLGLRGIECQKSKPVGVTRIAVLGGSSVFGYLVPDGEDSCCELQRILRQQGEEVEVLNAGVPGYNMRQCRYRFEHQISQLAPDIVVLYLGWNDSCFLIAEEPSQIDKTPPAPSWTQRAFAHSVLYGLLRYRLFPSAAPRFAPPPSAETRITELGAISFDADLCALIDSIRKSEATPLISTQLTAASGENCDALDDYLGSNVTQVESNRKIGEWIAEKMRMTADAEKIPLIDCASELPCDRSMLGDAVHLTKDGHRRVAELWAERLLPLLQHADAPSNMVSTPDATVGQ